MAWASILVGVLAAGGTVIAAPAAIDHSQAGHEAIGTLRWSADLVLGVLALASLLILRKLERTDRSRLKRRPALPPAMGLMLVCAITLLGLVAGPIVMMMLQTPALDAPADDLIRHQAIVRLAMLAVQAPLLIIAWRLLSRQRELDQRASGLAEAVIVGVGGLLLFVPLMQATMRLLVRLIHWWTGDLPDAAAHETIRMLAESTGGVWLWVTVAQAAILAPIVEEIVYRGLWQGTLLSLGLSRWAAIGAASTVFMISHIGVVEPHALPGLFVLSLGFGWAYSRTGRLGASIVMHALFNAGNLLIAWWVLKAAA